MATFITVAQQLLGRLLEANRLQTSANRFQLTEAEQEREIQRQARLQREQRLTREGRTVDGTLLSGSRRKLPPVDELAAFRRITGGAVGHAWWFMDSEAVNNDGFFASAGGGTSSPRVYRETVFTGFKRTSRIYCGNGSQHVEIIHGQQPQQMVPAFTGFPSPGSTVDACVSIDNANPRGVDDAGIIALPVGRDVFVLVFFAWNVQVAINSPVTILTNIDPESAGIYYPTTGPAYQDPRFPGVNFYPLSSFSKVEQVSRTVKTFICSNTGIREITPPGAFASILATLLPEPTVESYTYGTGFPGVGGGLIVANSTKPVITPAFFSYSGQGMGDAYIYAKTPAIYYDSCNEVTTGTPPASQVAWSAAIGSIVKPLPENLRWLVPDTASGGYAIPEADGPFHAWFNAVQMLGYGQWLTPGEEPGYFLVDGGYSYDPASYQPQPRRALTLATGKPTEPATTTATGTTFGNGLYAVWDWDDPNYCRQVCLALGFTGADLTP